MARSIDPVPDPVTLLTETETADIELRCGDCLDLLPDVTAGTVDFAYLDPPFLTGERQRGAAGSFDDRWADRATYLDYLRPRIERTIACLHEDGAIMIHCDWRTSHVLRVMLEEFLGPDAFVNHLIWTYGLGGSSKRRFARKHDDILYYAKGTEYYFDPPRVPATSRRMAGQSKKATDVLDVPSLNNMARERTGYPTQKPLALLEMLISAACPPGGTVLDPCCGSGTTLVAAQRLGRRAIGFDENPEAIEVARSRLTSSV